MNIRQEAWMIIVKVLKNEMFSDKLLTQSASKMQNKEHLDLLYYLVKGVIKMKLHLEYIIAQYTDADKYKATDLKIKALLYLAFFQLLFCKGIPQHAAVHETVDVAKNNLNEQVAGFVNAILREYIRNPQIVYPVTLAEKLSVEYSFPVEIMKKLLLHWDAEQVEYLCMYYNEPPKLYLRVNSLETNKNKVKDYFAKKNIVLSESNASKNMLISTDASVVLNDVAFSEGYYTIQDISAALVIELLDPQKEESILDLFAGRGTKTSYISELMNNTGEIIAVDKIPHKIKELKHTLNRVQATNVRLVVEDAFKFGPVVALYDRVIIDVPCSGWGVFQKKAELRWQVKQDIAELLKLQEKAFERAKLFVKPE
ncbi:MAG: methyltransferase domain-containing protein, partial [Candidatus Cloacimonetes bacterium]|nr:methyltransferase domain-containing protein [Candidatus Cloacimonadota bacterium]